MQFDLQSILERGETVMLGFGQSGFVLEDRQSVLVPKIVWEWIEFGFYQQGERKDWMQHGYPLKLSVWRKNMEPS